MKALTVSVKHACQATGLGRTSIYKLLKDNSLESVTIGKRRLILVSSIERLLQGPPEYGTKVRLNSQHAIAGSGKENPSQLAPTEADDDAA